MHFKITLQVSFTFIYCFTVFSYVSHHVDIHINENSVVFGFVLSCEVNNNSSIHIQFYQLLLGILLRGKERIYI